MVHNRRGRFQIICSMLVLFSVAVMPLEGISGSPAQAAESCGRQEAPRRPALEEPPLQDAMENYTLAIGKVGNATLTYSMSDRKTAGGVAAAHIGEGSSQTKWVSIVPEIPPESKAVEPKNTGLGATGWQNIMSEDFEGTFPTGLWATFDNDGAINGEFYWDDDDYKPHWGYRSAWCANGGANGLDPEFYYYPDNLDAWMTYGPFSLADATDAELSYYFWLNSQYDHDFLDCEASIDGTHFYGYSWTGYTDGWVADSFDLTDVDTLGNLCGQPEVWIAFIFTSDDETVLRDGAFIDDIVLRKYVAGAVPHIDSLSPSEGPVDARVVISGSDFGPAQGASAVTFSGVNADVSSWSDAQIVVWVPEGAGSNVVVHTTQGDGNSVPFAVSDSPVDYWAVIVGVEDYPGTEDDLDYPNEDAWDVHDALLAGSNWEEGHITMLLDSDATKANIHNAITQMGSDGDGNDLFFFHYSGHGSYDADQPPIDETDGLDEYLAQYDYATDPIWDDEFAEWLAVLPGRKVAVSLDACHSGGQVKATNVGAVRCVAAFGFPAKGDGFVRDLDDIIGGVALAASAEDESSWDVPALQNGLYTYYFVEGLGGPADSNADDEISMEEAFDYLDPLVSGYSVPEPQNPQMYDGYPGELVILLSELNNPPNTPSSPSPTSHAAGISINSDLSWTGGDPDAGDTVTYDVYFGTSATPPLFSNDQSGSTYDPGTLSYNTKYYWYVGAMDNHGASVTGPLWDFTTQSPPPSITVTSPNGGENWLIGSTQTITWASSGISGNVHIGISRDGGSSWSDFITDTPNDGSESWIVTGPATTQARIRVTSASNPSILDMSDSNFIVSPPPSITVTSPNGGENWNIGSSQTITWTSSGVTGNVNIDISRDEGGSWSAIYTSTPNDGSESWMATGPAATQARIRVTSASNPTIWDRSDSNFIVSPPPSITVTSPNGGEDWNVGSTQTITWTSSGVTGNVNIAISRDGGETDWSAISTDTPNDGNESWTVTGPATTQGVVMVWSASNPTIWDRSDSNFSISPPASITVTYPNGGENWNVGSTQTITWTSSGVAGNVHIYISRDEGGSWSAINTDTANDGSESWAVTGPATTRARIMIVSASDGSIWDMSDSNFSIYAEGVTVSIDAPDEVAEGSDFIANVAVDYVEDFNSCGFDVTYNVAIITVTAVTGGEIDGHTIDMEEWHYIPGGTEDTGRIRVIAIVPGIPAPGVTGTGYIAQIHYHVLGSVGGVSSIHLENLAMYDYQVNKIPTTTRDGAITVTPPCELGDANMDGVVDTGDITKVKRIYFELDDPTPCADVNTDGFIDTGDITAIKVIYFGA